jgi:type I restriction enzyme S subunit
LEEQRRILKALQGSSALTNEFVNTLQVAESARDSLVVELYKYGIRGESTKMTSIGLVPRSWSIEPLGNRYSIQLGKMISKAARLDENDGSHIPYLRNANVQWNKFELDDVASMTFTQGSVKSSLFVPEIFSLARVGTLASQPFGAMRFLALATRRHFIDCEP